MFLNPSPALILHAATYSNVSYSEEKAIGAMFKTHDNDYSEAVARTILSVN